MALKPDRQIDSEELGYFINGTASPGAIVVVSTAGSGVALDSTSNVATVSASSSGQKPLGMLQTEFVNIDLTKYPVNWHKDQANSGDKASIVTKGWLVTDKVVSATAGNFAVLASSGAVMDQPAIASWNQVANPRVGRFRSNLDEAGFAKLYVDL